MAWLVERINGAEPTWDLLGFLDDNEERHGMLEGAHPVIGGCDYLESCKEEVWAVCAIGSATARKRVIERAEKCSNVRFATLVDPSVLSASDNAVGEGSIICAGTILTVNVTIGRHVIVNLSCTIGHDAVIEDFVTAYPSVNVSGGVTIGREAELGTGAQVIQGKRVGHRAIIGAGAVVVRDLPCDCTAVGVPARPIRR